MMGPVEKDEMLDSRFAEVTALRARIDTYLAAVGRVLEVCEGRDVVPTGHVKAALAGLPVKDSKS